MVSTLSIVAILFSLLIIFGLPIGMVIWLRRRHKASLLAVLVGALVFLVFQILFRLPILAAISTTDWYQKMVAQPLVIGLFLALTAGLVEEVGRWLGFRFLLRGRWQIKDGIAYGLGHGGFEAMVLVGLTYVNNLVVSLIINAGKFQEMIAPALGASADLMLEQMISVPASTFSLAGVERLLGMLVHVGLSLVVLQGLRQGRPVYLLYAILLHTLVNLPAVLLQMAGFGASVLLGYLALTAVVALVYVLRQWKAEQKSTAQQPAKAVEPSGAAV